MYLLSASATRKATPNINMLLRCCFLAFEILCFNSSTSASCFYSLSMLSLPSTLYSISLVFTLPGLFAFPETNTFDNLSICSLINPPLFLNSFSKEFLTIFSSDMLLMNSISADSLIETKPYSSLTIVLFFTMRLSE